MGWIGHTSSIPDGHVVKRTLEWNPQGSEREGDLSTPGDVQEWQSWRGNI